ncbi:uncharacterized protein CXorf58 [Patella vulgata]|uniref:uncharacterized protein CXorf58 n=1 Tax=Patella vulgata TaxID=6465 RepID=UPI0021802E7F|nr:uncharacterized protein CXorf58 [Patella vulgata]XP_050389201.1 uncharacterized protein CXorf58 [Patella vulgata]
MSRTPSGSKHSGSSSHHVQGESRTSINVKLPSASTQGRQTVSPDRKSVSEIKLSPSPAVVTPRSSFSATLQGQEYGHSHRVPSPTSTVRTTSVLARSLRNGPQNEKELIRQAAASIIERGWIAHRDKQMFRLLKHSLCAAETSLSYEILRKVCPAEAEFFKDKSSQIKVRFRFGGGEFPPMIFFKVFSHNNGKGLKYLSGKKLIRGATEAAEDSLKLMGNRLFYDHMIQDAIHHHQYKITDEVDITTLKDYMQYIAILDETPAYLGGKDNFWRKLTLDVLPRHTIFYDIVDYAYNNRLSTRLKEEITLLMIQPLSQEIKLQQINAIAQMRSPWIPNIPVPTPKSALNNQSAGRRTKQARLRALKMRRMYGLDDKNQTANADDETYLAHSTYLDMMNGGDNDDDWEQEANKLYEWTQDLSFHDDLVATPRLLAPS